MKTRLALAILIVGIAVLFSGCTLLDFLAPDLALEAYIRVGAGMVAEADFVPSLEADGYLVAIRIRGGNERAGYTVQWGDGQSSNIPTTDTSLYTAISHLYSTEGDYTILVTSGNGQAPVELAVHCKASGLVYRGVWLSPVQFDYRELLSLDFRLRDRGCDGATGGPLYSSGVLNLDPGVWELRITIEDSTGPFAIYNGEYDQHSDGSRTYRNVAGQWIEAPEVLYCLIGNRNDQPWYPLNAPASIDGYDWFADAMAEALAALDDDQGGLLGDASSAIEAKGCPPIPNPTPVPDPDPITPGEEGCTSGRRWVRITIQLRNQWTAVRTYTSTHCAMPHGCD